MSDCRNPRAAPLGLAAALETALGASFFPALMHLSVQCLPTHVSQRLLLELKDRQTVRARPKEEAVEMSMMRDCLIDFLCACAGVE
jgi:predicted component of type VI protein secretion system